MAPNRAPLDVAELREEIARLDRTLVLTLAAREAAVRRLFELKRRVGLPLIDPAQEAVVRARTRHWADELGIPGEGAVEVVRAVLTACKEAQTAPHTSASDPEENVVSVVLCARERPSRPRPVDATRLPAPDPTPSPG